jgi:hypothetical protein
MHTHSGVNLAEASSEQRYGAIAEYQEYKRTTPMLFPNLTTFRTGRVILYLLAGIPFWIVVDLLLFGNRN